MNQLSLVRSFVALDFLPHQRRLFDDVRRLHDSVNKQHSIWRTPSKTIHDPVFYCGRKVYALVWRALVWLALFRRWVQQSEAGGGAHPEPSFWPSLVDTQSKATDLNLVWREGSLMCALVRR